MTGEDLAVRVTRAAEGALTEKSFVAPVDVLVRMGWLQRARS